MMRQKSLKSDARSRALYRRATAVMVGGVNSPVRAFRAVGGDPLFVARGRGSKIWSVDGKRFTDYVCSWGPMILGHSDPSVLRAVRAELTRGTSFGAPTESELKLAEKICERVPSIEKVRLVNSGTEATMSALRLARAYTRRELFLKFDGCYHGHADPFLTNAGSGLATFDVASSAGLPRRVGEESVTIPYNDIEALESAFSHHGKRLSAVIIEPVAGNMGVIPPRTGFLQHLRRLCSESGTLLIFDEVITGFRLSLSGAQGLLGVKPDITCLGKIIGGGFPVGAYGASGDIMKLVSPEGPVYQAGTLAGNPIAAAAGLATIRPLESKKTYLRLEATASRMEDGLRSRAREAGVPFSTNRVGSMLGIFFSPSPVTNFADAKRSDAGLYAEFHGEMLRRGVYLPPSAFETLFLSAAHALSDVDGTLGASEQAFSSCARADSKKMGS
jgi:glutamate-1-semialdehyde 2,1-aminomutase